MLERIILKKGPAFWQREVDSFGSFLCQIPVHYDKNMLKTDLSMRHHLKKCLGSLKNKYLASVCATNLAELPLKISTKELLHLADTIFLKSLVKVLVMVLVLSFWHFSCNCVFEEQLTKIQLTFEEQLTGVVPTKLYPGELYPSLTSIARGVNSPGSEYNSPGGNSGVGVQLGGYSSHRHFPAGSTTRDNSRGATRQLTGYNSHNVILTVWTEPTNPKYQQTPRLWFAWWLWRQPWREWLWRYKQLWKPWKRMKNIVCDGP